jgi:hypothetical protein
MIEIASDNHIGTECKKLTKNQLKMTMFETIEEFHESEDSSCYDSSDCSAYWACIHEYEQYVGNSIYEPQPVWATHVWWYSK